MMSKILASIILLVAISVQYGAAGKVLIRRHSNEKQFSCISVNCIKTDDKKTTLSCSTNTRDRMLIQATTKTFNTTLKVAKKGKNLYENGLFNGAKLEEKTKIENHGHITKYTIYNSSNEPISVMCGSEFIKGSSPTEEEFEEYCNEHGMKKVYGVNC